MKLKDKKTIVIRNPKKGFYAVVEKDFSHIPNRKTIVVRPLNNRVFVPKFKRFYRDTKTKYSVHYDLGLKGVNPLNLKGVKKGDKVFCCDVRKISKTKSKVVLLYDPLNSKGSTYVKLN